MNLIFEENAFFDCHSSGQCCRANWVIPVESSKVDRLREIGPPLAVVPENSGRHKLGTIDGQCTFLNREKLCEVHRQTGADSKPNACQLFPFVVFPTADGIHIGVSHFCPSARNRRGRPLKSHATQIRRVLTQMEIQQKASPALLKNQVPLGLNAYQLLETELLERIEEDPARVLLGLLEGLTSVTSWWNREISEVFLIPSEKSKLETVSKADSLAHKLSANTSHLEPDKARSLPYLRSLIRRKYLLRRPFLEGLENLAIIHFVVGCAENWEKVVETLESYVTHTSHGRLPL